MKPKTSPTSPKVKEEKQQEKELDNYYKESLQNIQKPLKRRTPIWFLFVVIIFGFLAGILGQLVLLSYGSEIPYFDKLDIFSLTETQPYFVSRNSQSSNINDEKIIQMIGNDKNSIVQIFELNNSNTGIESLYLPQNQLGLGLAITNDGYILTSKNVIGNRNSDYVIITENKEVYLINEILDDPVSNLSILKTDARNLKVIDMVSNEDILNNKEILVVDKYGFDNDAQVQIDNIKDYNFQFIDRPIDYINSTEIIKNRILLDSQNIYNNSLAISLDNKIIGIVSNENNKAIIYPFYQLKDKISSILENNKIIRPYLGINYINLSKVVNISSELSQNQLKGALIYTDEEGVVQGVIKNSPAEKAGLQISDIILSVNNTVINGGVSLSEIIQTFNAGDNLTLKINRQGEELDIKITLETI